MLMSQTDPDVSSGSMTDPADKASRDRPKMRAAAVTSTPLVLPPGEVHEEGEHVIGSFFLPHHKPHEVKYHVGRRTITLWSRKEQAEFQTILVLPRWVNPETFILTTQNGVYEFVLERSNKPPALPA